MPRFALRATADPALIAGVRSALMAEPELRAGNIHILALHGVVRLSGILDSGELLQKATLTAGRVPGVCAVESQIVIRGARRS
jgi:hyperosmotically inducible periplasmic protein